MRKVPFFLFLLLVAGCDATTTRLPGDHPLSVTLEKTVQEDAQAVPHTKAILRLSGEVMQEVDLGDIQGELMMVNPSAYDVYREPNADVVAVLTSWFAGQGQEIIIAQSRDPHALTVTHRYGDEEGTCTAPTSLAHFPLQDFVQVTLSGFEPAVGQSSLQFCYATGQKTQ